MASITPLIPRQAVPQIEVKTVQGGTWNLAEFEAKGVSVVAISSDGEDRAMKSAERWKIDALPLGYGLSLEEARKWGLYISSSNGATSTGDQEPALFSEPGLFLVRPDGSLYFGSVQTMPFARPDFAQILGALDFVIAKGYPARGEVIDHTQADAAD